MRRKLGDDRRAAADDQAGARRILAAGPRLPDLPPRPRTAALLSVELFPGARLAPDAPEGLGVAMAGGAGKRGRSPLDYYPTPIEGVLPLIRAEWDRLGSGPVWEPCARGGRIVRAMASHGRTMIATDIIPDPAHGVDQLDLLAASAALAPAVLSNLPWALGRRMVAHLWGTLRVDYLALLFKAQWMHCREGAELVRAGLAPTRRWDLTFRLDFQELGNPTMDCSWFVWDRADPAPRWGLLDRQGPVGAAML